MSKKRRKLKARSNRSKKGRRKNHPRISRTSKAKGTMSGLRGLFKSGVTARIKKTPTPISGLLRGLFFVLAAAAVVLVASNPQCSQ